MLLTAEVHAGHLAFQILTVLLTVFICDLFTPDSREFPRKLLKLSLVTYQQNELISRELFQLLVSTAEMMSQLIINRKWICNSSSMNRLFLRNYVKDRLVTAFFGLSDVKLICWLYKNMSTLDFAMINQESILQINNSVSCCQKYISLCVHHPLWSNPALLMYKWIYSKAWFVVSCQTLRHRASSSSTCSDALIWRRFCDLKVNRFTRLYVQRICVYVWFSPIQTSPKQPWPSLTSSRRDSRGISQASLASPWVWGFTVGHTVVSL